MTKTITSLFKFSAFFLLISTFYSTAHAIVVAPLIAISILHLVVQLLGLIAIPVAFIVKLFTKAGIKKVLLYSIIILIVIGGIIFCIFSIAKTVGRTRDNNVLLQKNIQPSDNKMKLPTQDLGPVLAPLEDRSFESLQAPTGENLVPEPNNKGRPSPLVIDPLAPIFEILSFEGILTMIKFSFILILVPTLLTILAINHEKKMWTIFQAVILAVCITLVLEINILFIMFGIFYKNHLI